MTCKINADTSDGLKIVSDTSGAVDIQSNGVTKVTIDANGNVNTVGQVSTTDNGTIVTRQNAKPLIINGDMAVAQRGTVTGITTTGTYTLDRIRADIRGGFGVQVAQSTDVPSGYGFGNSLKLDVTTADTSPDANGLLLLGYHFEGQDVQLLKYGTSSAETVTIAFWIKSNKTGTFQVNLRMVEAYHIGQLVTISSADTWEKKVITFVGNTANAMVNDNSDELRIQFFFDAGSNHEGGGVPSSWAAVSATKDYNGSIDLGDNTANEVLITGLQMEVGEYTASTLPAFQHESFGDSLLRCQRYYEKSNSASEAPNATDGAVGSCWTSLSNQDSTTLVMPCIQWKVEKRVSPTMTYYHTDGTSGQLSVQGTGRSVTATYVGETTLGRIYVASGGTHNDYVTFMFEAAAEL